MIDNLLIHAREFTNIEVEGLTLWNELQDAGEKDLARRLLDSVLMAEHYTSVLDHDAALRTPAQLKTLQLLRALMDSDLQEGRATLAKATPAG